MNDIESLRQEAESLKNQIRVRTLRPKDDQTMMDFLFSLGCSEGSMWCYSIASSTKCRSDWSYSNAYTTNSSRSSCQNLCYALGIRCQVNSRQTRFRKVSTEIFFFFFSSSSRNLVSASQDGKLIVWDSYTTNKVCKNEDLFFKGMNLFLIKKRFTLFPFVRHGLWHVLMRHPEILLLVVVLTISVQFIHWKHVKAMYVLLENYPVIRDIYHAVVFLMILKLWQVQAIWHGKYFSMMIFHSINKACLVVFF